MTTEGESTGDGPMDRDEFAATIDLSQVSPSRRVDATLEPTMAPRFRRDTRRASLAEARAKLAAIEGTGNTIRIKSPIAEGGMGRVMLAEQGGLRREVAAKTLRDDFLESDFAERLTREARITGLVEHPNIVPVYALLNDERGAPMMVMKKIEGVSWRTVIRDESHPILRSDRDEPLEWHLRVLTAVCDALSFAHSRGILHLDVKPDNVMVGAFRDVYLVDWGVACSMKDEHRGFLPVVGESHEILGTPAYLAPEMVDPKLARVGPRTDVFLLGATLYEVLTKSPPYRGESVRDILYEAYLARPPELPDDVPKELAAIVRRAMSHKLADRYASPDELRTAIDRFLRHRASTKLADESRRVLESLKADAAEPTSVSPEALPRVLRGFNECRFGFAHALREWPENVAAADGMSEVVLALARFHLERGEHSAAASVLDDVRNPSERYAAELASLRAAVRAGIEDVERLRELREHHDDARSRVARAYYVLGIVVTIVLPLFAQWGLGRLGRYRWAPWHSVAYIGALLVVGLTGALVMRRSLMPNRVSRRLVLSFGFLGAALVVRRLLAYRLGHHEFADIAMDMFLVGAGIGVIGLLTDRRFLAVASACMAGAVGIVMFPAQGMLLAGIAGLLGPVSMAAMWLHGDRTARRKSPSRSTSRR